MWYIAAGILCIIAYKFLEFKPIELIGFELK